jgi:hypothetical protein
MWWKSRKGAADDLPQPKAQWGSKPPIDADKMVRLHEETLTKADFSGRKLMSFSARACRFEDCSFDRMTVETIDFGGGRERSIYIRCSFDGCRFDLVFGGRARFEDCNFTNISVKTIQTRNAELVRCKFSGRIGTGQFYGSDPDRPPGVSTNEFVDNDFSECDLRDVEFRNGIDLTRQKLPRGPDYLYVDNGARATQALRAELTPWPEATRKHEATLLLKHFESNLATGQRQLFFAAASIYKHFDRQLVQDVFAIVSRADGQSA